MADCELDQLGGNAIFVTSATAAFALRVATSTIPARAPWPLSVIPAVRNPLFESNQRQNYTAIDKTPGPKTDNYPADCTVEDCLIRNVGVVDK